MGSNVKIDISEMIRLEDSLKNFKSDQVQKFIDGCAKELAARLLAKVVKRTPVGVYPASAGKIGGTLRRGWTAGKTANAVKYAESLEIHHNGSNTVIEIVNPVEYAEYVEFGHRTRNHKGWVQGKFMLTISSDEIQNAAPHIIEAKLKKELGAVFK